MDWPIVQLESFEGPFDLLLELAARRKLDLGDVPLASLTDDFLRHVREYTISAAAQGEWLVVAAQLLLLKARGLAEQEEGDAEEEESQLQERVRVYQMYRTQAERIRMNWGAGRLHERGERTQHQLPMPQLQAARLREAFADVLERLPKPERARAHLVRQGRSLEECLLAVRSVLEKKRSFVFQEEWSKQSRQDAAVSFLAVLELHRSGQAALEQNSNFEALRVRRL